MPCVPLNLVLVISSLNSGGAEKILCGLANYWASKGHVVTLLTLADPTATPFYSLDSTIKLIQLNHTNSQSSVISRFANLFRRIHSIRCSFKKIKPDFIISFMDIMNITTLIAGMGLRIPIIVSERIDPCFHKIPLLANGLRLLLYPFSHYLIVQTESAFRYFPSHFRKFMRIIPNPVRKPKVLKKNHKKKATELITVGRLSPQKNHSTLIYAFSNLVWDHPNLSLTIYGEGSERGATLKLISDLNLNEKIKICDITASIEEVLVNKDLFIFPSLYEGFPNALCEAMAIGLPVIASDCSGNIDVVSNGINGMLFSSKDVNMLTRTIKDLLDNKCQRATLSKNARGITSRFDPDLVYGMWDNLIKCR